MISGYIVMDMPSFFAIVFLMGMSIGLLMHRAVKDVLAWRRWTRRRYLNRPPPADGWKVRIPKGAR